MRTEWRIGETTDDTERTVAVARAIFQDGDVRHASVGREMLTCIKSVHPGVKSLWEFHQAGDSARVTDRHDGCGAAFESRRLDRVPLGPAGTDCRGGPRGLGFNPRRGAGDRGCGGYCGRRLRRRRRSVVVRHHRDRTTCSSLAERDRAASATAAFAAAVQTIHEDLHQRSEFRPAEVAARYFPNGPLTIVPLALASLNVMPSAEAGILLATNIGGDSDSVASIAGAILGARYPDTVNNEWYEVVERVNSHDLRSLAEALNGLRH